MELSVEHTESPIGLTRKLFVMGDDNEGLSFLSIQIPYELVQPLTVFRIEIA